MNYKEHPAYKLGQYIKTIYEQYGYAKHYNSALLHRLAITRATMKDWISGLTVNRGSDLNAYDLNLLTTIAKEINLGFIVDDMVELYEQTKLVKPLTVFDIIDIKDITSIYVSITTTNTHLSSIAYNEVIPGDKLPGLFALLREDTQNATVNEIEDRKIEV